MKMLQIFVIGLSATLATGCATTMPQAGATEAELCRQWGGSLPTRSRQDTAQTAAEIQQGYAVFSLACPDFGHLVP